MVFSFFPSKSTIETHSVTNLPRYEEASVLRFTHRFVFFFLSCHRYYYRCTYKDNMNCPATKQIQQKDHSDPPLYQVTYYNEHSCNSAFLALTPTEFQLQTASGKAVSICFDSSGAQEPGANASSPSSSAAPRGTPSENKNKPLALRSEALSSWGPGVVEQKTACADLQSCSTECQDAYISEDIDAGRFGSIRFFHFL